MVTKNDISINAVWNILKNISDPEIPVLTIVDLGIVRDVRLLDGEIEVVITPTYTGCPAMDMIAANIRLALSDNGFKKNKNHDCSFAGMDY